MKKQVKKKSEFLKIAQSLGIAVPASLLFATNADAALADATANKSMQLIENPISLLSKNEVKSRIVWEITDNKKVSDLLSHTNTHTNSAHTNRHADRTYSDGTHTNTHSNAHTDKHTDNGNKC